MSTSNDWPTDFLGTRDRLQQLVLATAGDKTLSPAETRELLHLAMNLAELSEGMNRRIDALERARP